MDFDTAKENIQPLRHGRRADRLELALGNEKELLDQERKQHEELIESSKLSQDPLGPWYEYICWIEQSYLKSGVESGLDEAISKCLCLFENEPRYKQDRRLIKLFIKYIDTQDNPQELYNQLYMNGIGTMVADLYIAWSYYYDAADDFKQTETIFRRGLDAGAQPYNELVQAHQNFSVSMSQRIIYNDEESKKKFQVTMEEKRGALTMLRAHKKKTVGSIRTGFNVLNENPGRYESSGENEAKSQVPVMIHEDDGSQPSTSGSIIKRNIVDGAKKKNENFLEPGPWSKVKMKTGVVSGPLKPGFEIMEDDVNALPPIKYTKKLYEKGAHLPDNFVAFNNPQKSSEKYAMIVEEPVVPNVIPCYEKFSMYPNDLTEISPEEVRGFRWFVKKGILDAPVVEKYADLLLNKFENGPRLFPCYPRESIKNSEVKYETELEPLVIGNIQLPMMQMYEGGFEIKSMEELLADKFQNGKIKLVAAEDFEEDLSTADMDLTLVYHGRQSVHPLSRKSFVPRKSILRKSIMPQLNTSSDDESELLQERPRVVRFEDPKVEGYAHEASEQSVKFEHEEDSNKKLNVLKDDKPEGVTSPLEDQRMSLKRKLETPDKNSESKNRLVSDTPPSRPDAVETKVEVFKPPFPPIQQDTRKSTRGFEILDDEDTFCSTQQFNFFVKASSISTPNNSKKTVPRLVAMQPIPLHDSPEKLSPPQVSKVNSENEESPNSEAILSHQHQTPAPKQLSTIMETTETTHSTKSTLENETTLHTKTPMSSRKRDGENEQSRNAFDMFRIPEEQTETLFQKSIKLPRACEINDISMQKSLPMIHGNAQSELSHMFIPKLNESSEETASQKLSQVESKESVEIILSSPEDLEFPATQDQFHFEIPATQEQSHLEIPATQDVSHMMIPPLMNTSETEIPNTEEIHLEIPATQELPEVSALETKKEEPKAHQLQFQIYEDSFSLVPPPPQAPAEPQQLSETKYLHLSCKENFGFVGPKYVERVASDEFLALCGDSPEKSKKNEQSDLLKFSTHASIEGSFKAMELNPPAEPPKSASPTMNIFEDDLNTERFKFPLNGEKNSTLLYDVLQKKSNEKFDLNLSFDMNEEELNHLKSKDSVFKVPSIPALKLPAVEPSTSKVPVYVHNTTPFSIFEDSIKKEEPLQNAPSSSKKSLAVEETDDEDDMSKTIFYKNYEKEVIHDSDKVSDDQFSWEAEDQAMCSFIENDVNRYEYTIIQTEETEVSMKLRHAIELSNGDPFCQSLRNVIMEQVDFEKYLEQHVPQCKMLKKIPQLKRGMQLEINSEIFSIGKFIAKGSFGSIFIAEKANSKEPLAAKQEKPANLWEYFICMELGDRLKSNDLEHMLPAFMQINYAIIGNNASVFFTEFSPFGTIIDVCNKIKKVTGRPMDEYIGIVLTTQLLSIIDFLHACHIIHGDVKPDNFLLLSKVELGSKVPALQLIDFGAAIDMEVYSKTDAFKYVVKTEYFTCCEMLEKRPWTYQTDLFGLAGTAHVMLFGKYMEVEKKIGKWDITSRYPRYFQKDLWSVFFSTLLNVPDSFSMPNLQELKEMLLNAIACRANYVSDKLNEFNSALLS